jgi:hypothetical protein
MPKLPGKCQVSREKRAISELVPEEDAIFSVQEG